MKYLKYSISFFFTVIVLFLPLLVLAQATITEPCTVLPVGIQQSVCQVVVDLGVLLWYVGISLAVVVVIWAGIKYMTAGADETKVTNAKKILLYGLIGAAIVIAAHFILELLTTTLEHYGA